MSLKQSPDGAMRVLKSLKNEGVMNYETLSMVTGLSTCLCQQHSETLYQQGLVKIMPFGGKEIKKAVVVLLTPRGKAEAAK